MTQANAVNPNNTLAGPVPLDEVMGRILHREDGLECSLAVRVLAQIGDGNARDLLIRCLHHDDPDVRGDAGSALADFHDEQVVASLVDNLKQDPLGENKVIYIRALQALGDASCANILRVLVQGRGESDGVFWDDGYSDWDDWLDVQRAAIEALGFLGSHREADLAVIISALADPDGQELWALACRALARLGLPGCRALGSLLDEASPLNRKRIATALACADDNESEKIILQLLQDVDAGVRLAALESGGERKLDAVCRAGLQNTLPAVRAKTLEVFDDHGTVVLAKCLGDVDTGVRIAACNAVVAANRPLPGLALIERAERHLRSSSPEFLAALVAAMAVAEPGNAAGFVEEIANHKATKPVVRLAALRALGRLKSSGAVDCLAQAAGDDRQDIRLEAIVALGEIANSSGIHGERATIVLASAIEGGLKKAPPGWQPEDGNIVPFEPKKKNADDESDTKVLINREGEVVGEEPKIPADEDAVASPPPVSTLEAILSFQPAEPETRSAIEINEDDIAFLELTGSRPGKRKINPDLAVPAHIDVQRLAARIAGQTGKEQLVLPLATAAASNDKVVCETALESLNLLATDGVDISGAGEVVLQQSSAANKSLRCRAIETAAWIDSPQADEALERALADPAGVIRASGLAAISTRGGEIGDLQALCRDPERSVRQTAATLTSQQSAAEAIPELLAYALIENATHKNHAGQLLANHGREAMQTVLAWVESEDQIRRIVGLELLSTMLRTPEHSENM